MILQMLIINQCFEEDTALWEVCPAPYLCRHFEAAVPKGEPSIPQQSGLGLGVFTYEILENGCIIQDLWGKVFSAKVVPSSVNAEQAFSQ